MCTSRAFGAQVGIDEDSALLLAAANPHACMHVYFLGCEDKPSPTT